MNDAFAERFLTTWITGDVKHLAYSTVSGLSAKAYQFRLRLAMTFTSKGLPPTFTNH